MGSPWSAGASTGAGGAVASSRTTAVGASMTMGTLTRSPRSLPDLNSVNNFPSSSVCEVFCESAACGAGEEVARGGDGALIACAGGGGRGFGGCPEGYACVVDGLAGRSVCCGAPVGGVCPAGLRTYLDAFTNAPLTCILNAAGGCPPSFACQYSFEKGQAYCCESNLADRPQPLLLPLSLLKLGRSAVSVCGPERTVLVVNNGQAVGCSSVGAPGGCPTDYTCVPGASDPRQYFCCRGAATPAPVTMGRLCPPGLLL